MSRDSISIFIRRPVWAIAAGIILVFFQCRGPKGPSITVYSSSQDGDRMTRLAGAVFEAAGDTLTASIRIDEKIQYQKIDGFGASLNEAGMICLNSLTDEAADGVLKMLFDEDSGAGFNAVKSPIAACDFASAGPWYSYNDTPGDTMMEHFSIERDLGPNGLIPLIKKVSKYADLIIESPMDFAPDWMYYGLEDGEKFIKPEYYNALARYYSKFIQAYAANGININYLNLFNEPHNSWYSNVTYETIGKLIKNHVAPRLKADGLSTKIQFGEASNRPEAIEKFPGGLDDPEVRKLVHSMTVHGYDWDKFSTLDELHERYPELPIWQVEVCYSRTATEPINEPPGGPEEVPVFEFSDGEFWGNMIMNDLKHWVSVWIYWNLILDHKGGPSLVSVEHGASEGNHQHPVVIINRETGEVTYTGLYYYLAHFSKFIRPGARRIECSVGFPHLNAGAFKNADGSLATVVINNGNDTECKISWNGLMSVQLFKAHSITTLIWGK